MNKETFTTAYRLIVRMLDRIHLAVWLFEVAHWLYRHGLFVF